MSRDREPTETSPLLRAQGNGNSPNAAVDNGFLLPRESDPAERDQAAAEAQDKEISSARSALKYIVPAISIGV